MRVLPMGDRALLVEVDDLAAVLDLRARLDAARPDGVRDLVPAARTVLVDLDPRVLPLAAARSWVERVAAADPPPAAHVASGPEVGLRIRYDGPDLDSTAALLGLDRAALIRAHRDAAWTVAFTGFAPGFGYLVARDWPHDVPRLDSPRTWVPAGAVGLAAGFTGAYPRDTPGGWRLLGTLDPVDTAALFDPDAASPSLLAPGTPVRFREVQP
ncbi:Kinase A inhibitor [Microbacterium lemovicicum]|uniref:Kinase A inhibitor n=2 Tax=Microbacterium lemovicicum TaxID=1072463 RepID=A0A3Q9IXI4_9MICO|nr:Kinase A inhibitor [Microbacterium lemovicicum]